MKRTVLAITGSRAEYGLMRPVFRAVVAHPLLELQLVVTGMHLRPEFSASLEEVRSDGFCRCHELDMALAQDSGGAMAESLGIALQGLPPVLSSVKPDMLLLQGDRGEMLAGAIAAAHMNIPIVHMSGGDFSGTIDDSIRHAISKFAHLHLTTCSASSARLLALGEQKERIIQVGEPGLDVIRELHPIAPEQLAAEFGFDLNRPLVLAAQHPVTTEADQAGRQMRQTLEALEEVGAQVVFSYPNTDAGGREMTRVLESYRGRDFIRIVPHLGSEKFLSLMRMAAVLVGNSSSGILEAASFKIPVVNVGTRQHGRLRATNVIDVGYSKEEILAGVRRALEDQPFRSALRACVNPYGDGLTGPRTADVLARLRPSMTLLAKWLANDSDFLSGAAGGI